MPRKPSESTSKNVFQARVTVVPVAGASVLKTFGEDWPGWMAEQLEGGPGPIFLRLRPPADVPDSRVEAVADFYRESLGWSVKVEKSTRADVVPREEAPKVERPHARAREVVEGLLSASRSDAREELAEFVRRKMDEAKL